MGIRVDYLSPTLYFLDVLWLLVFVGGWREVKVNIRKYWWVGVFIAINVVMAERGWLSIYRWARIFQMGWMGAYFVKNKRMFRDELVRVLPIWICFESFLGLGQIIWGRSLEGVFYWLGERRFSYSSIGAAQMAVLGRGIVRAYGTFSHPNSMAGFLLVAELLWVTVKAKKKQLWWWMVFWSGLVGIIISGSRTVWLLTVISLIFLFKERKRRWGFGVLFMGIFMLVLAGVSSNYVLGDWLGGWDSEGLVKRWNLNAAALEMIKESPLLGVGLGNFLVKLPEYQKNNNFFWLQPVHNIFLLLISEIGILGLWGLTKLRMKFDLKNKGYRLALGVIAVTGMVDHYWLSLPQNSWLLVVMGVLLLR